MTKTVNILFLFLTLLLTAVSCEKIKTHRGNGIIDVGVSVDDTKSTVTTTDILKASGAFSMMSYLSDAYFETDDDGNVIKDATTGEPILYDGTDGLYFSGDGNVTISSGSWSIADTPKWVNDVVTYFWAWHPVSVTGRTIIGPVASSTTYPTDPNAPRHPYTGQLDFKYTTPTPDGVNDADTATDLIFAYTDRTHRKTDTDETINLTFHHALAQVRFCVSTDDGTFDKNLKINNISISNLRTYGEARFSGSSAEFVWTNQTGSKTFGQDYNTSFLTSTVTGWTKGSYTKNSKTYNLYTCENVFFMIPQTVMTQSTVSASNMLTVTFEYDGEEIERSVYITGKSTYDGTYDTWKPDHYYTYKINATTVGRDVNLSVSLVGWSNRKEEIFI